MISNKKINLIVIVAMVLALTFTVLLVDYGNTLNVEGYKATTPLYAAKIFGTEIISLEILADEKAWQDMLDNAINEQYIKVDVIVNGTKFTDVGIRPKGNSSLSEVARDETSDRYSFRIKFDEYIKDQTCFGLDSFVLNNMLGDKTYMKEYISYDLMNEMGVDSPYFGYTHIKLNGETWGLYLAVETYGDSYESRVSGTTLGMLYNVKGMDMGGGAENNGALPNVEREQIPRNNMTNENAQNEQQSINNKNEQHPVNNENTPNIAAENGRNGFEGGGLSGMDRGGNTGGSLAYIDENSSSYSAIFENIVGTGTESDYQKVIAALKALSEGKDIESYFNVDKILRYLAVHTIVVNLDSYSSNMAQNYYLYEKDGIIDVLPWDYNLAWGGFENNSASSIINFPIDTPVSGVEMSDRPLLEKLFGNTEYLERYHSYLQEALNKYLANGLFEVKVTELNMIISDYVKNDPTKFCTFEEYETAVTTFITLGEHRAKSVQGQLDGTVPKTTAEQSANPDKLISPENLNISELGSIGGGRQGGQMTGGANGANERSPFGVNIDEEVMQQAMEIIQTAKGEINEDVKSKLLDLGLTEEQIEQISNMANRGVQNPRVRNNQNQKGAVNPNNSMSPVNATKDNSYYIFIGILLVILVGATIVVANIKRKY